MKCPHCQTDIDNRGNCPWGCDVDALPQNASVDSRSQHDPSPVGRTRTTEHESTCDPVGHDRVGGCPHCGGKAHHQPYGMNPNSHECNQCGGTWHSSQSEWVDRPTHEGFWWFKEQMPSGKTRLRAVEARIRQWDDFEDQKEPPKKLTIEIGSVWVNCERINADGGIYLGAKFQEIQKPTA